MTTTATEVTVPDIGAFENVPIIELHVKAGDQVNEEDPLITLESDKATMDVPASGVRPGAGRTSQARGRGQHRIADPNHRPR